MEVVDVELFAKEFDLMPIFFFRLGRNDEINAANFLQKLQSLECGAME